MRRTAVFIVFLVVYVLWVWIASRLTKKSQANLRSKPSFWTSELMFLQSYAFFFGSLYLLSALWVPRLVLFFFVAAQIPILGTALFWSLTARRSAQTVPAMILAGADAFLRHPLFLAFAALVGAILVFLVMPIMLGIVYFKNPTASPHTSILIIRCLSLMQFGFYPVILWFTMSLLASENLDDQSRVYLFIGGVAGLIPTSMFLALGLWAFDLGEAGTSFNVNLGPIAPVVSLRIIIFIGTFFLLTTLIPYLIGTRRAKEWRLALLEKQKGYLTSLAEILRRPAAASYAPRLTALRDEIVAAREKMVTDDRVLAQLEEFRKMDADSAPKEMEGVLWALKESRQSDPRLKFEDTLSTLANEVSEILADLAPRDETSAIDKAAKWAMTYDGTKTELNQELDTVKKSRPTIMVGLSAVSMTIISTLLSEFGKHALSLLTHSAK